jgi:hypothetical protein
VDAVFTYDAWGRTISKASAGHLAAILVEWLEYPLPWESGRSDSDIAAGDAGATLADKDCNVDCCSECNKKYPGTKSK